MVVYLHHTNIAMAFLELKHPELKHIHTGFEHMKTSPQL